MNKQYASLVCLWPFKYMHKNYCPIGFWNTLDESLIFSLFHSLSVWTVKIKSVHAAFWQVQASHVKNTRRRE